MMRYLFIAWFFLSLAVRTAEAQTAEVWKAAFDEAAALHMDALEAQVNAYAAALATLETEVEAWEVGAEAWEASVMASIAWARIGEASGTDTRQAGAANARENAQEILEILGQTMLYLAEAEDLREAWVQTLVNVEKEREVGFNVNPEQEAAVYAGIAEAMQNRGTETTKRARKAREAVIIKQGLEAGARQMAQQEEGNMMMAQANAKTERVYAALWERVAGDSGVSRTAWIRSAQAWTEATEAEAIAWSVLAAAEYLGAQAWKEATRAAEAWAQAEAAQEDP